MPRISLAGFKDPVRRPRYLILTFVAVVVLAAVMIVALGVTSTRWFCSEGCHKVQDDTITAYKHSSHSRVSCMACHMPVGSSPVTFILHKAEALGELYLTVTNSYELPLNGESEVALTMASTQCTQCHNLSKRPVTPDPGLVIDHDVHAENKVNCTICHNRIAHKEDFVPTLLDPNTGKRNSRHEDFMSMTACFRCHTQGAESPSGIKAPGRCDACHTPEFQLKPPSHLAKGFFPEGHAKLAAKEYERAAEAQAEISSGTAPAEGGESGEAVELAPVASINECLTCHAQKFCDDCHGLQMPHPADFKKGHGALGKKKPEVCANCHGNADQFCDECHHGTSLDFKYDTNVTWRKQHPQAVQQVGAQACFECHAPTYCAQCHVNLGGD